MIEHYLFMPKPVQTTVDNDVPPSAGHCLVHRQYQMVTAIM